MTKTEITQQALRLPDQERYELIHTLWSSLDEPGTHPSPDLLPKWQQRLLDERLAASAGEIGEDWSDVKAELWPQPR
jgi:putative addiction module component (TIGR02574 family)